MPEKKVEKALKIVGIVLLVFIVIFASAVTTLYLRARRRRATHRTTLVHQIPLSNQPVGSSNGSSSRGQAQQAARTKSIRERERMNLAFGVVDDDESRAATPTPSPYGASVSMPASSATMANPYGALVRATKDPFQDPVRQVAVSDDPRLGHSSRAINGGNALPRHPISSSHSSTSSPQRPPPAKQANTSSPVRREKGTYRSDSSQRQQQYIKADDRALHHGPGPVKTSRSPARAV